MAVTASEGTYRSALRVREFDALAGSSLISILGDSAAYVAVTVLVYQRTGSALLSALTFAVAFLPYLFGGTLLAALVDRLPPKSLLVGFDLLSAALVAVVAGPAVPLPLVYVALVVIGTLAPVRSGAASTVVAEVLTGDTFVAGRSVQRMCSQGGQIVGTALGGALVATLGPHGAMLADTVSFLLSAAVVAAAVRARRVRSTDRSQALVSDSLAGMRGVWGERPVRRLLLLTWTGSFLAVVPEGLAAPAIAQAGRSPGLAGLWLAAAPMGMVLGDLAVILFVAPQRRRGVTRPLIIALPLVLLCFALRPSFSVEIGLLFLLGTTSAYGLGLDQAVRDATPACLQGRMFTLNYTGLMVVQGLGFAAGGAVADVISARATIALTGLVGAVVLLTMARKGPASA